MRFLKPVLASIVILLASGGAAFAENQTYESENVDFQFACLPYLVNVGEDEATVIWATTGDGVSWVEIAPEDGNHFYGSERQRFYETELGCRKVGKIHKVRLTGLKPATPYRYRVYSQEVDNSNYLDVRYGKTIADDVYSKPAPEFTTRSQGKETVHFGVVNDIHCDTARYSKLLHHIDIDDVDFMLLNGDMANDFNSMEIAYNGYLNTSSAEFARKKPLVMVRGNHETRGRMQRELMTLFPTPTGMPYFTFTYGPLFFVVLDAGEDKPDSDIEYCGLSDFDNYRMAQTEWLKAVVSSEEFKNAPFRVAIMHVPPVSGSRWHGENEVQQKFMPLLNNAGIDLMLSGHLHRHSFYDRGEEGLGFPVLINSNRNILDIKADAEEIYVKVIDEDGKTVKTLSFDRQSENKR